VFLYFLGAQLKTRIQINHIDLSPTYAGVLMGVTNTVATIPGIVSPTLTGYILGSDVDHPPIENWRIVFFIAAGFYALGVVTFALFASGEQQNVNTKSLCGRRL